MIQDIWPDQFHNQFAAGRDLQAPGPRDAVFLFSGRSVLCRTDEEGNVCFPGGQEIEGIPGTLTYLFSITVRSEDGPDYERRYFLLDESVGTGPVTHPAGYDFAPLRDMRSLRPKRECFAAETGHHLAQWYANNRYCGRCREKMRPSLTERAMVCSACGNTVYPRINPAVIVGVTSGDRLLMTKYAGREFADFALIAGFCEIGETVEETVQREVMEEVGLKVKNLRYYKSQPWGFDGGLLFGYFCDVDGSDRITVDRSELSEAAFYERHEIQGQRTRDISLTNEMMLCFRDGKEPR